MHRDYIDAGADCIVTASYQASFDGFAKVGIERVFDRAITNEITNLESKLIFLSTTTTVCPFIGLFGTVWGIMVAFQGFGLRGTVSIAALAPGLSTALLTTIGGLFCAIPASILYNYLTNKVRVMTARMDSFALELSNIIQKQITKQEPPQKEQDKPKEKQVAKQEQ